jgi:hypothetical protein
MTVTSEVDLDFALTTPNLDMIMDVFMGIFAPNVSGPGSVSYPPMRTLDSPYWVELAEWLPGLPDNEIGEFSFEEMTYLIIVTNITTSAGFFAKIIFTVKLDSFLVSLYEEETVIAVVEIGSLGMLVFLIRFFAKLNSRWKAGKLRVQDTTRTMLGEIQNCGPVGKALCILREIQLRWPDKVILNDAIDKIVDTLTQKPNKRFIGGENARRCSFCSHLLGEASYGQPIGISQGNRPYEKWRQNLSRSFGIQMTGALSRGALLSLNRYIELDFDVTLQNPAERLVNVFIALVGEHDLLFDWFDPDSLVKFAVDYIQQDMCRDPLLSYLTMQAFHWMLAGPFHGWIQSKAEILAFFLVAFVLEMRDPPFDPVLCDAQSRFQVKWQNFLSLLKQSFPFLDQEADTVPQVQTLLNTVKRIILTIRDCMLMESIGQLRIRIESGEFTTQADRDDRILFFSNLLKLCAFTPYFLHDVNKMVIASERITAKYFTDEEAADEEFVARFHCEHASRVTKKLLGTFTIFRPLGDIEQDLENTTRYWHSHGLMEEPSRSEQTKSEHIRSPSRDS